MKNKLKFLVLIAAIEVSVVSSTVFFTNNQSLLYRDAKSHLNIAKRVFASQTPGLAQLGGVWLPMPHLLMLPTVWNDEMYYSGLSGIIPSMIAFILLAMAIFSTVYFFTKDKIAGVIASSVILSNPSLLYLQSTPMSELLLLCFSTLSLYFIIRWATERSFKDIILAALFIFLATLTRYDAWFLFVAEFALVLILPFIKNKDKRKEGEATLFVFLGGFGIVLWLLYSKLIFGNFLNFALGQGSGSYDTKRITSAVNFSSVHNLPNAFLTYSWMTVDNIGIVILVTALVAIFIFLLSTRNLAKILCGLIFLSPFVFNILALYLGQSVALSNHLYPYITYNLRYGVGMIPVAAFFLGFLASKGRVAKGIIVALIIFQAFLFYTKPFAIIADAKTGEDIGEQKVSLWILENPTSGNTLLSTLAHDPLLFQSHISMNKVIYEGNQKLWSTALSYPEYYATRVVFKVDDTVNDAVRKRLYNTSTLKNNFIKVYDVDGYEVYDKKNLNN